ncbi:MAG: oligosaccharide flippase family protein [Planctomycetota bacterium]
MTDHTAPDATRTDRHEPLGRAAARGMSFMVLVGLFGKLLSTITTIVLGILLTDTDFGLYGLALGLAGILSVLRDGGVKQIAIQRGPRGFRRLYGPVGWMSLTFNTTAGLILAGIAPIAAQAYAEPTLMWLLFVTALSAPLITVGSLNRAQLQADLRHGTLARVNAWNNFARYTSMIVLASLGAGPFAFVVPYVIVAVVDGVYSTLMTRTLFFTRRPRLAVWPVLFARAKWTLTGTLGLAVLNRADYLVLGLFLSTAVVGLYTFAFQLAIQVNTVLASNFQSVIFPTLARFADDRERHRAAVVRATRMLALVSSVGGVGLACVFPSLEAMIWNGKWRAAVIPAQLMCLALPMRMCMTIHNATALSLGRFKGWAAFNWAQGAGLVLATILAGVVGATRLPDQSAAAAAATAVIAGYYALVIPVLIAARMRRYGVPARDTLAGVFGPWIITVAAGAVVLLPTSFIPGLLAPLHANLPGRLGHAAELVLRGAAFALLIAIAAPAIMPKTVAELIALMPDRTRPILRRLTRTLPPKRPELPSTEVAP